LIQIKSTIRIFSKLINIDRATEKIFRSVWFYRVGVHRNILISMPAKLLLQLIVAILPRSREN